jgi:DNA invertase Pin-like site-specific DNA recombinase
MFKENRVKTQAVSYLRVSGKGQVQGDGFPRQRAAIAAFAKGAKLELLEEFRDEGVSGTTELEGRPGLAALLDRIESNGVKVVVIERADRLARDLMVSEVILAQFAAAGAKVLTADGADLSSAADDPTRTLIRQVLAAVAQFDKSVVVLKLRAARERLRRKGLRVEGRKPYGFHPNERAIVAHMQALRAVSRDVRPSLADVAAQLNAEGHTTRYGKQWTPAGVFEALRTAAGKPRQRA